MTTLSVASRRPPTSSAGVSQLIRIDSLGMAKTLGISRVATNLAILLHDYNWCLATAEVLRNRVNGDMDAVLLVYIDREYRLQEEVRNVPVSYSGLRIQHVLVDTQGSVVPSWAPTLQLRQSPTQQQPLAAVSDAPVILECHEAEPPPPLMATPRTVGRSRDLSYLEEYGANLVNTPTPPLRATTLDESTLTPFNKVLWSDKQEIARLMLTNESCQSWLQDVTVCPYTAQMMVVLKDEWIEKNWRDKDIATTLPVTYGNVGFCYQIMPRWLHSQLHNTVMPYGVSSPLFLKSILQRMVHHCHVECTVYFNAYLGALIVSVNKDRDLLALRQSVPLTLGIFRIEMAVIDQIYQVSNCGPGDIHNHAWGSWRISTSDLPVDMAPKKRFATRAAAYEYMYSNLKPNCDWRIVPVITDITD